MASRQNGLGLVVKREEEFFALIEQELRKKGLEIIAAGVCASPQKEKIDLGKPLTTLPLRLKDG